MPFCTITFGLNLIRNRFVFISDVGVIVSSERCAPWVSFVIPVLVTFFVCTCNVSFIINKKVPNVPSTVLKVVILYLIEHEHLL